MDYQFYPTPPALAQRAWGKFKNRNFVRVMDPSAGKGDLIIPAPFLSSTRSYYHRSDSIPVDCCEIDPSMHPVLREAGYSVVGVDFMQYTGGHWLSHIIMNPPFMHGADHVLKAWEILWDGEVVAIINAETIRNPYSAQRQMLVRLIERHGEVEFIEGAFAGVDAERQTDVDVALVYLRKEANLQTDILGEMLGSLAKDQATSAGLARGYQAPQELAIPNSTIENTVVAFNAAVQAAKDAVYLEARATYYTRLLGKTLAEMADESGKAHDDGDSTVDYVRKAVLGRYNDLKDRAWSCVLRSTKVTSRLSSAAQQRLESEFASIKQLEFTVSNVYGFLCGLVEKQGEVMIDMACDVFDRVTRYHTDNTVYFKGWKSNDKHRTCGQRMRTNRFIIPGHSRDGFYSSIGWESERMLADFDKVFAMLDGKQQPEIGLVDIFKAHYKDLYHGARIASSYFEVRYYPGAGTIHFFAKDKVIVDRLNRLVGRRRQWLPPEDKQASDVFWKQYDQAEKLDKEIRAEVKAATSSGRYRNHFGYYGPFGALESKDEETQTAAMNLLFDATTNVLRKHDMDPEMLLKDSTTTNSDQMLLLLAA